MTSMIQFLAGGMKQCASRRMGLLLAAAATVGMLSPGGASGQTVYQGTLYSSAGIYDTDSRGGLIVDSQGNLFGTTFGDGVTNGGTVFEIVPDPTDGGVLFLYLHGFPAPGVANGDGSQPAAGLVMDSNGNLYGTTSAGGANGYGAVFELLCGVPAGQRCTYSSETILYSFNPTVDQKQESHLVGDGAYPFAGLFLDSSGNLYGTTTAGGTGRLGTVFELVCNAQAGQPCNYTEQVLYSFLGPPTDGRLSTAGLIMDSANNLYGTTTAGGVYAAGSTPLDNGTVFELLCNAPPGGGPCSYTEQVLYSFPATSTGGGPAAGLIMDGSGDLFGTTVGTARYVNKDGTVSTGGAVFELANGSGTYSEATLAVLGSMVYSTSALIADANGDLFGTTANGGANGQGMVFELANTSTTSGGTSGGWNRIGNAVSYGSAQDLYDFAAASTSTNTSAPLVLGPNGVMYGVTNTGGLWGYGTVFELAVAPSGTSPFATQVTVTAAPSGNLPTDGQVRLHAVVTASPAGLAVEDGSVTFRALTTLGTAPVSNGEADLTVPVSSIAIADGSFRIGATYTPASSIFTVGHGNTTVNLVEPGVATTLGSNTFTGNQTVNGMVTATGFSGDGSLLSNVTATGLSSNASILDSQVTNLGADLIGASNAAVATAEAFVSKTYLPLAGGTLTGSLSGTSANFSSVQIGGGSMITGYVSVTENVGPLGALNSGACTTMTTAALSGFAPGTSDTIALGVPSSLANVGSGVFLIYQAWETTTTASPTITIQICNASSSRYKGGASGMLRVDVFKHM